MILGIVATSDRHPEHVPGIARAALEQGHEVRIFATDTGVRLCLEPEWAALALQPSVQITYCHASFRKFGLPVDRIPAAIMKGSQFNNAKMIREADRVISL